MKSRLKGFSWTEVLLILAIVMLLVTPILRIKYGPTVREWQRRTVQQWGIPMPVYYGLTIPIGILLVYWRFKRAAPKKQDDHGKYKLPGE